MTDKSENKTNKNETGASGRRLWLRLDFIIIFALLALAFVFSVLYPRLSQTGREPVCEIILDGQVKMTVRLDENRTFSLDGLPNVVFEVKDGAAAFIQSDCPDKVCVLSGYQHEPGQMAVCLPNHAAIRIAGGSADAPDVVI